MQQRKPVIIAYDISNNRSRRRVFKILKEWSIGGQKSLCECRLAEKEAEELLLQLNEHIDQETDTILMAWIEPRRNVLCRGTGVSTLDKKIAQIR